MTTTPSESKDSPALEALVELGRDSARQPTRAELGQGLNAVRLRLDANRARRRLIGPIAVVVVLAVLPLGWIYGGGWLAPDLPALSYDIDGGTVLEGGYLRESGRTGIRLSFNEGTRFVLTPGTRGRLRSVNEEGARIGIENGSASFEVNPATGRRWEVEVGPFLVTVMGTAFSVLWDPSNEQFELTLRRGRVVVSGPVSGGELTLQAGQRLVVSLPKAETVITDERASVDLEDAVADPVEIAVPSASAQVQASPRLAEGGKPGVAVSSDESDTSADSSSPTSPPSSSAAKAQAKPRWAEELAHGRWDEILADVERVGVASTLNTASSEDLFAVANAARYRLRTDLARNALLAQRRRFPQSHRALDATFLLGRVEEARGGVLRAGEWYDEYLARAPGGTYAAEALGRKMTIVSKSSSRAQARPIARDYLRRFPKGSYAGTARALLDEH